MGTNVLLFTVEEGYSRSTDNHIALVRSVDNFDINAMRRKFHELRTDNKYRLMCIRSCIILITEE
jgi:hypothetical protein